MRKPAGTSHWIVELRHNGKSEFIQGWTKLRALEIAQGHCLQREGNSASVIRRRDKAVAIRYWSDSVGLQFSKNF